MLICALLALLTPIAARTHVYLFITFRFMTGLSQGVVFPAQQSLFAKWNPPLERSRLTSLGYAGAHIGYVIAFPIAALLCEYGFDSGWPSIFYVCGIVGVCWFLLWMYFVYDSPRHHPRISQAEQTFLTGQLDEIHSSRKKVVPWLKLLTSLPVWAISVAYTCCHWGEYTFATNIPTYMKEVLKFDIKTNGFLSALPYIGVSFMTNASGHMADYLIRRKLLTTNQVRKLFNSVGAILPAIFVIGTGYLGCENSVYAVVLLTMGVTTMGCQYGGGFMVNPIDIAPNFAGIVFGISNTFATLPGFFSPYAIGELTQNKSREEWQTVFFITSAIYVVGAAAFIMFGSGYRQDWDQKESAKDIDPSNSIELANNL
ncbi:hypothetical protein FSP39_007455 [Pinctada imbricata]|uniref:Major facilitator superfamily (MFS) profile domain-containing protein n=1 Tax=Pinctada imbricata TaxID=66713 RepID=A0AA88XYF6_PINIB|nr:hypothetical protein FSP39_007455 [Pinctada imbricata]